MRKTLLLAWTMFRGTIWSAGMTGSRKGRKTRSLGLAGPILLAVFLILYVGTLSVMVVRGIYPPLSSIGMEPVIPALLISVGSILTFFFGVLYTMSVYYHASDVDKLLPLPFLPSQIIFAKFLTTLLYEYMLIWLIGIPALTTYGLLNGEGAAYYLMTFLVMLLLPITPLALASVLVILLMRFSPAARNKDRFNMISNIAILVVTVGVVFLLQRAQTIEADDLASLLAGSAAEIARITAGVFPGSSLAASALVASEEPSSWLRLAGFAGVAAVAILALMQVAQFLYFKGVMGVGASYARHKKLSESELQKAVSGGSAFWSYIQKDFRILLRTPVFFLNNIVMNVMFPLFFIGPLLLLLRDTQSTLPELLEQVREAAFGPGAFAGPIALGILSAAVIFICGMNGITASALSREGNCAYFMKIIPMSYRKQITAKIMTGILVSLVPGILMLVLGLVILAPPFWFILLMLIATASALLLPNLGGMLFDLRSPKLDWDDEQKAVKQNVNVLFTMLLSMISASMVVVPTILLQTQSGGSLIWLSYLIVMAVPLLADALMLSLLGRFGSPMMRAIQT